MTGSHFLMNSDRQTQDEHWMRKALALARRGEGLTRPNPPVGAVVVSGNDITGAGFHHGAGKPHAEAIALKAAGEGAKGATLYVTLEPCSTQGKTPPCTETIIKSGIARVVASVRDPNPRHRGRGLLLLKRAGIEITEGVCAEEGVQILAPFAKWITSGKPYVTLKIGMSMDGRIADSRQRSKWITCRESRERVRELRKRVDAILVGCRTVCIDDPSLLYSESVRHNLYRVIVDSKGSLPLDSKVLNNGQAKRTVIATTKQCSINMLKKYAAKGSQIWVLPTARGLVSLRALFHKLGKIGILHVLCEGGAKLAHELIRLGLVDEYLFFVAPLFIGGHDAVPAVNGKGWALTSSPKVRIVECERVGDDLLIRAVRDRGQKSEVRSLNSDDCILNRKSKI